MVHDSHGYVAIDTRSGFVEKCEEVALCLEKRGSVKVACTDLVIRTEKKLSDRPSESASIRWH